MKKITSKKVKEYIDRRSNKDLKKWKSDDRYWSLKSEVRDNKNHVGDMAQQADMIVCAWGCNHPGIPEWIDELGDLFYLDLCKDNITPKHPLGNLSKDLRPKYIEWYKGITN